MSETDKMQQRDKKPATTVPKQSLATRKAAAQKQREEDELSVEDKELKTKLDLIVHALVGAAEDSDFNTKLLNDDAATKDRLMSLADEIRASTCGMTSVPKPLKFLRPHFAALNSLFRRSVSHSVDNRKVLADILSVLATTARAKPIPPANKESDTGTKNQENTGTGTQGTTGTATSQAPGSFDMTDDTDADSSGTGTCLYYRLQGGVTSLESWGGEFMRSLAGDIGVEWQKESAAAATARTGGGGAIEEMTGSVSVVGGTSTASSATPEDRMQELRDVVKEIVPFYMSRNSEIEAIDLLAEVDWLEFIVPYVQDSCVNRVVQYLTQLSIYAATCEDYESSLGVVYDILVGKKLFAEALRVALRFRTETKSQEVLRMCYESGNLLLLKQLGYICFRHRTQPNWREILKDEEESPLETELQQISGGQWLNAHFLQVAQDLDVVEPKLPEEIYKRHLEEKRRDASFLDSARQNLAASIVNGLVNAGYCDDKLMSADNSYWIHKNKEHGMISAAASLGLINLWNTSEGLMKMDKFQWAADTNVKAGAYLGFGVFNTTVRNEWDAAYVLLNEHLENMMDRSAAEIEAAVIGIGLANVGSQRADLLAAFTPIAIDMSKTLELASFAAISLGLVFAANSEESVAAEVAEVLIQSLIDRTTDVTDAEIERNEWLLCNFGLALGLVFLGQRSACETTLMALQAVPAKAISRYAQVTVEGFAYAASGEVLQIQKMLRVCVNMEEAHTGGDAEDADVKLAATVHDGTAQKLESGPPTPTGSTLESTAAPFNSGSRSAGATVPDSTDSVQANGLTRAGPQRASTGGSSDDTLKMDRCAAVLNIPLIAMAESTGSEMVLSLLDHMTTSGSQQQQLQLRQALPLALALHSISDPKQGVVDTLTKLSHDPDADVALHAIISLGFVGAGTNNSRIAGILRQLAAYYTKDSNAVFTVRLAQGLLYLGKGLLTLNPVHSDGLLINYSSLASLLVVLHICLNLQKTILAKHHYLLFHLTPAIFPRTLVTVDENLDPLPITVRVGQALDTVGHAGQPKTITGFQTHTTPVVLGAHERAQIVQEDEYEPLTSVLEGVVIVRKIVPGAAAGAGAGAAGGGAAGGGA
eukprot:Lankesteria_metandrocarpae@DN5085_c2_g2_i2.p1